MFLNQQRKYRIANKDDSGLTNEPLLDNHEIVTVMEEMQGQLALSVVSSNGETSAIRDMVRQLNHGKDTNDQARPLKSENLKTEPQQTANKKFKGKANTQKNIFKTLSNKDGDESTIR